MAVVCLGLLLTGCTRLPEIGGMALPKLDENAPTAYPDLTDIPDAPPITPANMADAAIRVLSQERGNTQRAAGQLQKEPFIDPSPAPPPSPF